MLRVVTVTASKMKKMLIALGYKDGIHFHPSNKRLGFTARQLIRQSRSYTGYVEGAKNSNKFSRAVNKVVKVVAEKWCADFAHFNVNKLLSKYNYGTVEFTLRELLDIPDNSNVLASSSVIVHRMAEKWKHIGNIQDAKPGDYLHFSFSHVALLVRYLPDTHEVITIDGNVQIPGYNNNGMVGLKRRRASLVDNIARPAYGLPLHKTITRYAAAGAIAFTVITGGAKVVTHTSITPSPKPSVSVTATPSSSPTPKPTPSKPVTKPTPKPVPHLVVISLHGLTGPGSCGNNVIKLEKYFGIRQARCYGSELGHRIRHAQKAAGALSDGVWGPVSAHRYYVFTHHRVNIRVIVR